MRAPSDVAAASGAEQGARPTRDRDADAPLRVAMIGAGGFAVRHLELLARERGVHVTGHVARTPGSAEAQAARFGGRAYADVHALLDAERIDAAWLCLPPGAHGAIEEALVAAGVPFFVEKPLSADADTAERIAEAVAARGLVTAVGYHWRAFETIPEVRARLAAGPPVRLVSAAWHSSTPAPAWWRHEAESGGQMVEQATHLLDLALHLLGDAEVLHAAEARAPRDAYPDADVAEASSATLRFAGGALGVVSATCVLGGSDRVELRLHREGELIVLTQAGVVFDTGAERRERRHRADPVLAEDRAFLAAVRAGDPTLVVCSYAEALRTHRLAQRVRALGYAASTP